MSAFTIAFDTFDLGADTNKYDISSVQGLSKSDIRTSQFNFSGRSGGLVTDQFYGMRLVTITGYVRSSTWQEHTIDRRNLDEALPINTLIPVHFTLFDGTQYVLYANVFNFKMEYKPSGGGIFSEYKLDLLAGDPLFYSELGGDIQSAIVNRVTQGGYVTPYDLPVDWASGSSPTIVDNTGTEISYPVIYFDGSAINPSITNQTTGETFGLDLTMTGSDQAIIDMKNRTVTVNGSSAVANMSGDSSWWALAVGNNGLVLDSDSGSDTIVATVTWRNGTTGI